MVAISAPDAVVGPGGPAPAPPPDRFAGMVWPADQPTTAPEIFRVLTWNLMHFVDEHDSPYISNAWDDERRGMSERRVELFVRAIRAINPDVAVFEEVESPAFINTLARERLAGMGYKWVAGAPDLHWHQNVVVISRFPLGALISFSQAETAIGDRGQGWPAGALPDGGPPPTQHFVNNRLLLVEVRVRPQYWFLLAGLHLKAGAGERNAAWRLGQVRLLRARLARELAADPSINILLAGDLNSTPDDAELRFLLSGGGPGDGLVFVDALAGRDAGQLTMPSSSPARRIDYILPNTNMARELAGESPGVVRPLPPAEMSEVSDHLPVLAEFYSRDR
ncbi:MAG: endonuclease/exonuclease/phosphatase family protein [Candidatus Sumerlaeia bacterium]